MGEESQQDKPNPVETDGHTKEPTINAYQAKKIPLPSILAELGHQPHSEVRDELWYPSPFRAEGEPSFKVNQERNIWYDFGIGTGGNVIDFIMRYYDIPFREALHHLAKQQPLTAIEPTPATPKKSTPQLEISKIKSVENPALIQYLKTRGIPAPIARPYLKEMYYTRNHKRYFALAFRNDSGGYELRNPYFKGVHGTKDITTLGAKRGEELTIFEGFMDFLSYLALTDRQRPNNPVMVLNSTAMRKKAVQKIAETKAKRVRLYLDRDNAGETLTTYFQDYLKDITIIDESPLYKGYKDLNAYWLATTPQL